MTFRTNLCLPQYTSTDCFSSLILGNMVDLEAILWMFACPQVTDKSKHVVQALYALAVLSLLYHNCHLLYGIQECIVYI